MSAGSLSDRRPRRIPIPRPRLRRLLRPRALLAAGALALVLVGGWMWFRSSSLVRVEQVTITGLSGPSVGRIRHVLAQTAKSMTVLNLSRERLERAVAAYPTVHSLTISTHYPHAVTIAVNERVPLAEVAVDGRLMAVDAAGSLLSAASAGGQLPRLQTGSGQGGDAVISGAGARAALRVLTAAPYRLVAHISSASNGAEHGVMMQLRHGPVIYFGAATGVKQKWAAAIAVLANSDSHGAAYIDVTDPRRPAAGA